VTDHSAKFDHAGEFLPLRKITGFPYSVYLIRGQQKVEIDKKFRECTAR